MTNRHTFRDLSHVRFTWRLAADGRPPAEGELEVGPLGPGAGAEVALPPLPAGPEAETWLTVTAVSTAGEVSPPEGTVLGLGQVRIRSAAPAARPAGAPARRSGSGRVTLGPAEFEPVRGTLVRLGGLELDGPRLDVWRAPIDNDRYGPDPIEARWRAVGLDRMTHRLVGLRIEGDELVVLTRVAPAAGDLALLATYRWSADERAACVRVSVRPQGSWTVPLPRLGLRLAVPDRLGAVRWFGGGPGEAYADSRRAARVDAFTATVEELQTPYVFPQENGSRTAVRWAELRGPDGSGLRIEGHPTVEFTARRWTSEDLDAARHTTDLAPRDRIFVNADLAQHGLGSAACGPGPLPVHVLHARPAEFTVSLRPL
ncbi:beta-galactosidase small subunit family protein [Sphaerisporangium flaviroseum]|uniref:beta-galactosidase small subunit family protein n=1 Tax=Sphaerisporangium flaviroseum TaxID=509199 RepID=UPI003CD09DDF